MTVTQASTFQGSVAFVLEESLPVSEGSSQYETVTNVYHCNDLIGSLFMRVGKRGARSFKVTVDGSNSSEYSSFSMTVLTYSKSPLSAA